MRTLSEYHHIVLRHTDPSDANVQSRRRKKYNVSVLHSQKEGDVFGTRCCRLGFISSDIQKRSFFCCLCHNSFSFVVENNECRLSEHAAFTPSVNVWMHKRERRRPSTLPGYTRVKIRACEPVAELAGASRCHCCSAQRRRLCGGRWQFSHCATLLLGARLG